MTVARGTGSGSAAKGYRAGMDTPTPFERAVAHTLGIEGGYSDHPSDRGGKTNWGVTEAVAREHGYRGPMKAMPKSIALDIYRKAYWDKTGLDWIAAVDADVALEVFDTGVNMGVGIAMRMLQRVLNALNRGGRDYPDIAVDGVAGPLTGAVLRAVCRLRGDKGRAVVLLYLNALQGARYIELAEAREANEDFMFGWAKRAVVVAGALAKDVGA